MKKICIVLVLLIASTTLAFTAGQVEEDGDGGKTYKIKITHVLDSSHHYQSGAEKFKELVEEGSDGRIEVEIYPNAQLGGERSVIEGIQLNNIQMGIITSGALSGFVPEFSILDLGYLFKDNEVAQNVLKGELGEKLSGLMIEKGIRNLGFIDCGFRNTYGQQAFKTPDDLNGIKIRTMENPAHQSLFRAIGASPVPMAWPELYTGLQQGTVDAAENVVDVYYAAKHFEVASHYTWTNHVYLVVMFMISEKFYQSLPADLQDLVTDSAAEAIEFENGVFVEKKNEAIEQLEEEGVTFHEVQDIGAFQNQAKDSWTEMTKKIPEGEENLEIIMNALE